MHGLLVATVSFVAEHRLSSSVSGALLLSRVWHLPRLGVEPMTPVSQGRFFITEPPGKPLDYILNVCFQFSFPSSKVFFFFFSPLLLFFLRDFPVALRW